MYYIFQDIKDFKTYIGGGANVSIDMNSIAPEIKDAAEKHLRIWLGGLLDEIVENAETPNDQLSELLPHIKRPLACFVMFEYSPIGGIQFNESGIQRVETDRYKSAYKYQENAYKKKMIESGYEGLERLLKFLEEKENDYLTWKTDNAYQRNKELFLNYASEFRAAYSNYISRYTYELLRPLIEDIECFALLPLFGQAFFDELKTSILLKNLNNKERKLLKIAQKAIANFAIEEGMKRHWVRLEGKNVVQTELIGDQSHEKAASAGAQPFALSVRKADEWANRHISKLKKYLNDNLDHFPTYAAFLEEQAAAAEEEKKCAQQLPCGCWQTCTCNQKRAIVRL